MWYVGQAALLPLSGCHRGKAKEIAEVRTAGLCFSSQHGRNLVLFTRGGGGKAGAVENSGNAFVLISLG